MLSCFEERRSSLLVFGRIFHFLIKFFAWCPTLVPAFPHFAFPDPISAFSVDMGGRFGGSVMETWSRGVTKHTERDSHAEHNYSLRSRYYSVALY